MCDRASSKILPLLPSPPSPCHRHRRWWRSVRFSTFDFLVFPQAGTRWAATAWPRTTILPTIRYVSNDNVLCFVKRDRVTRRRNTAVHSFIITIVLYAKLNALRFGQLLTIPNWLCLTLFHVPNLSVSRGLKFFYNT